MKDFSVMLLANTRFHFPESSKINQLILITLVLVLTMIYYPSKAISPVPIDSADFTRIPHKKIRALLQKQIKSGVRTFDDISTACYSVNDTSNYRIFNKSLLIKQSPDIVWQYLTKQSPSDEFNGRIVSFGLLYSKHYQGITYQNEPIQGVEVGQVLFFNLRMLRGIKNLAVALEITSLDAQNHTVEYCYTANGNTEGTQHFIVQPAENGQTLLTQVTRYKCKSKFRNRRLYSFFHEKIVNEFFAAIKQKSESNTALATNFINQ
jgi:hypothetical protein